MSDRVSRSSARQLRGTQHVRHAASNTRPTTFMFLYPCFGAAPARFPALFGLLQWGDAKSQVASSCFKLYRSCFESSRNCFNLFRNCSFLLFSVRFCSELFAPAFGVTPGDEFHKAKRVRFYRAQSLTTRRPVATQLTVSEAITTATDFWLWKKKCPLF